MKRVEFLKKHPPYNVGETAAFLPEKADQLEAAKVVKVLGAARPRRKTAAANAEAEALRAQLAARDEELAAVKAELEARPGKAAD